MCVLCSYSGIEDADEKPILNLVGDVDGRVAILIVSSKYVYSISLYKFPSHKIHSS